ncbi:MAG: outer membrane protein assembly factor BamD [Deltaproteobacteria bacterium]|nr:MAG: outer membrane protein assembly factor BamD [Deltaproteobacteria bacterium]
MEQKIKRFLLVCIALSMVCSGCAIFKKKETESAEELVRKGMEQFNNKNYKTALEHFEKLRDWYPFSKYAILAELKIADSHYHLKEYEDAIFAYEEFIELHPRNEAIPYVIYQIGRCYFDRMDTIDRDQSVTRKALETFQRLNEKYPNNPYALKVEKHINECLRSLAGHELYVGRFYYKTKHYKAALYRFKAVLTKYPDVGLHQKALQYISLCEQAMAKQQSN